MTGADQLTRLARKAGRGDRAALAELIRATQADVWRLCAHVVDRQAADDLTQETYLRVVPGLSGFRGDAPFRSWLLTIARRVCAQEIQARTRGRRLDSRLNDEARLTPGAGQTAPDHAHQVELELLLQQLDSDQRAAFVLTQLLGCSYLETAAICDCPVGTVRSRVARARQTLVEAASDTRLRRSPAG